MASFISFSNEDEQLQDLARFFSKLLNKGVETPNEIFQEQIFKLVEEKKYTDAVQKLLDQQALLFADGAEKDIESFFLMIVTVISKVGGQQTGDLYNKIITIITSSTEDKPLFRLRLLNILYHIVNADNTFRFNLYLSMLKYSFASHHTEIVVREFLAGDNLEKRIKQLGASAEQIRALYKVIREILINSGRSLEAYHFGVKYLTALNGADAAQAQEASTIVLEAIRLPDIFQYDDLLDIPVVKSLQNHKDHGKLYQLLSIFVSENIESYKSFSAANASYMQQLGLKEEECIFKMRLLSLASLGAAAQEIPYSLIAKTLQLDEAEVESWVIIAISEGVLEAKMDQLKRVITISRCLQRVFTQAQWKQLAENLTFWRNNTKSMFKTLQETKQQYLNTLHQQQQKS